MAVAERAVAESVRDRWNQLYTDYYQLALGLARQRVRNQADAEDAVQKTFIGVYEILATGKSVDNWEAMIATIAKRAAGKERLANERAQALEPDIEVDQAADRDAAERRRAFEAGFHGLSEGEQRAVYYTLVEGLSATEVGERLGTSAESARHLLSRGRAALVLDMVSRNVAGEASPNDRPLGDICRYLANRMSSDERRQFGEHLKACARCRMTVERVREFRGFVLLLLPAGLVGLYGDHLYAQIQAQQVASKTRRQPNFDMRLVAAGLVLILLIGGTVIVSHKPSPPRPTPALAASACPTGQVGGFAYLDGGNVMYRSSPHSAPQQISSSGRADALAWTPDGRTLIYKDARVRGPVAGTLYAVHPGSAPFWSFGTAIDSFAISPDGKQIATLIEHDAPGGNWTGWTLDIGPIGGQPGGARADTPVSAPEPDQWQDVSTGEPFAESLYIPESGYYWGVFWFAGAIYIAEDGVVATFDATGNQTLGWSPPTKAVESLIDGVAQPKKSDLHFANHGDPVMVTCGSVTKALVVPPLFSQNDSSTGTLADDPSNPRAALAEIDTQGGGAGDIYLLTADGNATAITTDHTSYLPVWQP